MNRRSFLHASSAGAGLLSLSAFGCGATRSSRADASGSEVGFRYQVNERHFVYDNDSVAFELAPDAHRIHVLGDKFRILSQTDARPGDLNYPHTGEAVGGRMFFLEAGAGGIGVMDATSGTVRRSAQAGSELGNGSDLTLHADGNVYVCDSTKHRVAVFDKRGNLVHSFGELGENAGELNGPRGIAVDSGGNLHVVDGGNARVAIYGPTGKFISAYGGYGDAEGEFLSPRSIAIDTNSGRVCVGDTAAGYVSIYGEDGSFRRRFVPLHESGSPATPLRLSFDHENVLQIWSNGYDSAHSVN